MARPWLRATIYLALLYLLQLVAGVLALELAGVVAPNTPPLTKPFLDERWPIFLIITLVTLAVTLGLTGLLTRLEGTRIVDLGLRWREDSSRQIVAGLGLGFLMLSAVFVTGLALRWIIVSKFPSADVRVYGDAFAGVFLALVAVAFTEEIAFRGYILQRLEQSWGAVAAALLSAMLFSIAHGLNPGYAWRVVGLLFLTGLLFAYAYYVVRSLWLPIALHLSWNTTEGLVYGFPVSGLITPKLFVSRRGGPESIMGGSFGPEGGLISLVALAIGFAALYGWQRNRLRTVPDHGRLETRPASSGMDGTGLERLEPPQDSREEP